MRRYKIYHHFGLIFTNFGLFLASFARFWHILYTFVTSSHEQFIRSCSYVILCTYTCYIFWYAHVTQLFRVIIHFDWYLDIEKWGGAFYRVNKAPVSISIHLYRYNTFCMITYRLCYLLLIVVDLGTHHTVKHFDGAVTLDTELFLQHSYQVFNLSDADECKLVVVVAVDVVFV